MLNVCPCCSCFVSTLGSTWAAGEVEGVAAVRSAACLRRQRHAGARLQPMAQRLAEPTPADQRGCKVNPKPLHHCTPMVLPWQVQSAMAETCALSCRLNIANAHPAVRQAGQLPGGGALAGHVLAAVSTAGALPSSSRKAAASASRAAATPSVLLSMSFLPEGTMSMLSYMLDTCHIHVSERHCHAPHTLAENCIGT